MTTAKLTLTIMIAMATACAARPGTSVTPTQRATALQRFVDGASTEQIAAELAIEPADARACVRAELRTLMQRYRYER